MLRFVNNSMSLAYLSMRITISLGEAQVITVTISFDGRPGSYSWQSVLAGLRLLPSAARDILQTLVGGPLNKSP